MTVRPDDTFRVHCREWFDGALHNDHSADDVRDAPLSRVHALSGPIAVEGAEPGDLLLVDIVDVGPIPQEDSGRWPVRDGGRLSGVVGIPNSCATVYLPTGTSDFPVEPSASGPARIDPGQGAPRSSF